MKTSAQAIAQKIPQIIGSTADPAEAVKHIIELVAKPLGAEISSVHTWDDEEKRFKLVHQHGISPENEERFNRVFEAYQETVVHKKKAEVVSRIDPSVVALTPDEIKKMGLKALLVYPLLKSDRLMGIAMFGRHGGAFNPAHLKVVTDAVPFLLLLLENKIFQDRIFIYANFANLDGLTNLYSHRYFQESLTRELSRAQRFKYPISLLMIDIDHFKHYNDTYGHPQGDMVLREIAGIIKKNVRTYDLAARYGGEEIVVMLPYTTSQQAYPLAERLRRSVAEFPFVGLSRTEHVKVTISLGIASFPANAKTKADLIEKADQALYLAKEEGRNRICTSLILSKRLIRFAFVPPAFTSGYYLDILTGVKEVISEIGNVELLTRAPEKESDYEGMSKIINQLIEEKVDAIAISTQFKGIAADIKKLNRANIPVFMFNVPEKLPQGKVVSYIGYDQKDAGREAAKYVVRMLRGAGNVVILKGLNETTSNYRVAGFREVLASYPRIKVVAMEAADWLRTKATQVTEKILRTVKQVDAIFAVSDEMALGAVEAVRSRGKLGEIFIVGLDGTRDAMLSIKDGKLTATLNTNPREMGRILTRTVIRGLIKQEKIDEVIYSPINIVVPENVDRY